MRRNDILNILLFILMFCSVSVNAQDNRLEISPIEKSTVALWNMDISIYGNVSWKGKTIQTATNYFDYYNKQRTINQQLLNIGLEFDLYKNIMSHYIIGFGYGYNHLLFNSSLFTSTGIFTHWLNLNAKYVLSFFEAGVEVGGYLGGTEKSNNSKDVTGINPNCYNRIHLKPFIGAMYPFQRLKVEARLGWEVVPMLDADRIAYNNLAHTETNNFCFEIGLTYCIFRSMKYSKSNNPMANY